MRDDAQSGSTDTHGGCAVLQVFLCFTASRRQPNVQREDPAEETMYLPCRISTPHAFIYLQNSHIKYIVSLQDIAAILSFFVGYPHKMHYFSAGY